MAKHLTTGRSGEEIAEKTLLAAGYHILERNWRYRHLEVDFIARDGDILVFVEVKTRSGDRYGMPYESVDYQKEQKLARAANIYLRKIRHQGDIRFDIVSVVLSPGTTGTAQTTPHGIPQPEVMLIKDAFWPR